MEWGKILFIVGALAMIFLLYRTIQSHREWFSSDNLQKSLFTLGVLALVLIVFISLLVLLLKS